MDRTCSRVHRSHTHAVPRGPVEVDQVSGGSPSTVVPQALHVARLAAVTYG